jgi:hypothetical protein
MTDTLISDDVWTVTIDYILTFDQSLSDLQSRFADMYRSVVVEMDGVHVRWIAENNAECDIDCESNSYPADAFRVHYHFKDKSKATLFKLFFS